MFKTHEIIGIFGSIALMALALFLLQIDTTLMTENTTSTQVASPVQVVGDNAENLETALQTSYSTQGLSQLIIDDVRIGTGEKVAEGDEVSVHYVGRLENGQEFDSSYNRDTPFSFTVGAGEVIAGWEEGIRGMQVGGQRVLVVPPHMAYGERGSGPIPPNATLLFMVELLTIN